MPRPLEAIDLFCGVGGLTHGLEKSGVNVRLGVDLDPACRFPYEANNKASFLLESIETLDGKTLRSYLTPRTPLLLAGCAPCQPFSLYRQGKTDETDSRWNLLKSFQKLVQKLQPEFVTMENVPRLAEQTVFTSFVRSLERAGYKVWCEVVDCVRYNVPQRRERLVLLASQLGPISLLEPKTWRHRTVRQVISKLPKLRAGNEDPVDRIHQSSGMSPINMKRIRASVPGGSWKDWPSVLIADCHKRRTGKGYPSVYGRMKWDEPAPTLTTQFFGFGSGRFGHPEQDRAISLREGALLQSFPRTYRFAEKKKTIHIARVGKLIGNAVPVKLAEQIGHSILTHAKQHGFVV
jgi:DNA (cytosine-5)-methyltransferase 1